MDAYAPCPCGSGKKLKFCCQAILPEMAKIERLQENNQPRMALQLIDKLLKDHPQNAWLTNQRALALLHEERCEEARDTLVAFLRKQPDHPLSNALLALAMTELEPMENCRKVIHRAFLKSMAAEPRMTALLAGKLVNYFLDEGHDMAARQHMAVVLRLEGEEERQRTLLTMLELDSDSGVPYPLRGGHPLPSYQPSDEAAPAYKKAQRLYVHACFSEAADLLDQIAGRDGQSPELWRMIGLMRAWDGDAPRAAAALHQSAAHAADFEAAVETETIAQLLERRGEGNSVAARMQRFDVESLSRLLTRLDNEDRLCRMPLPEEMAQGGAAANYEVLDRPLPPEAELGQLTPDTVPRSIGQLMLFDQHEDDAPLAHVVGIEGDRLEEAVRVFERCAGELAKRMAQDNDDKDKDIGWYSRDELALTEPVFFPQKTPGRVRAELRRAFLNKCIHEQWMNAPQGALGGKSPQAASGDAALQVPLAAALRVLDAFLDRRSLILDQAALRSALQLPAAAPLAAPDDVELNALTVPQLDRLELPALPDELFYRVLQRALVVKHCGLGYKLLKEFVTNRPQLVEQHDQEAEQAYATLADICARALREAEALEWIEKGFTYCKSRGRPFESLLRWKMRELTARAQDVQDPAFRELLLEVWNQYGMKVPALRPQLEQFVQIVGIDPPWQSALVMPEATGGGGVVWTAQSEQSASGEKKLWLPD